MITCERSQHFSHARAISPPPSLRTRTFDRIIDGTKAVLVRFDKEYSYGDEHDAWKASDYTIEHEFRAMIAMEGVDLFMARIANDPRVTPETLAAMEHLEMRQRRRERRLEQAFAAIDDDQGGDITLDELRKEMRRADARVSEWQVKARWRELDVNADGKVESLQAMCWRM